MTAFKTFATIVLIVVLGLAFVIGPLTDDGGRNAPGPQSPPDPSLSPGDPTGLAAFLALVGLPLLGLAKRVLRGPEMNWE